MTTSTPGHEPDTTGNSGPRIPADAAAVVPAWLLSDTRACPGARLLYGTIAAHLERGHGWPETPDLADMLGIAERTVRAQLRELVLIGAVHREKGVGYHTGQRYRLRDEPAQREGAHR